MTVRNVVWMLSVTVLIGALVFAGAAWAAPGGPSQPAADPQPAIDALAAALNIPVTEIQALYDSGVGLGIIAEAYVLSDALGLTPAEIIAAKTSGEVDWAQLLKDAGLDASQIRVALGQILANPGQKLVHSTTIQAVADPQPTIAVLADYLGVPVEEIQALYDSGVGLGIIAEAYVLSDSLGLTPAEIIAAKTSGEVNWGQMLKDAGLQPGQIKVKLGDIVAIAQQGQGAGTAGNQDGEQQRNQERVENRQQHQERNENGGGSGNGGNGDSGSGGGSQGGSTDSGAGGGSQGGGTDSGAGGSHQGGNSDSGGGGKGGGKGK